ncbi:molybdopterin dehydrogenase, FAD-binding protein [Amycolatopsis methanolica 239]|uniref:Molybdopterin dehydrogenase, FAD-binding protein n=1 Tax=Amycolatopsis methanolica 239 TaxID=1068978 RepID=A0A076MRA4_AMYME|nr:molybdopterin dehydrogenase, FAD-binding protein [Amycolatopsis methanolica 239]
MHPVRAVDGGAAAARLAPVARRGHVAEVRAPRALRQVAADARHVAQLLGRAELDGVVADARVAAGGVATVPWRLTAVEAALRGKPATEESFTAAAALATDGARPLSESAFKLSLLPRTIVRALLEVTEGSR